MLKAKREQMHRELMAATHSLDFHASKLERVEARELERILAKCQELNSKVTEILIALER
jgi:hypothetical protein